MAWLKCNLHQLSLKDAVHKALHGLLSAGASSADGAVRAVHLSPWGATGIGLRGINRLLLNDHRIGLNINGLPGSLVNQDATDGCRHRPTPATTVAPCPMTMPLPMTVPEAVPVVLRHG